MLKPPTVRRAKLPILQVSENCQSFKSHINIPATILEIFTCTYSVLRVSLCNASTAEEPSELKCILCIRFVFFYFQLIFWLKQTNFLRSWYPVPTPYLPHTYLVLTPYLPVLLANCHIYKNIQNIRHVRKN